MQAGVETVADEMTRKFAELSFSDEEDKKLVEAEFARLDVAGVFNRAAALCGYFGGCLVYLDTGDAPEELSKPLALTPEFIARGSLRGLRVIEPVVCTPGWYESSDPLKADYFEPRSWFVQSTEVHASRLLLFRQNVPRCCSMRPTTFSGCPPSRSRLTMWPTYRTRRERGPAAQEVFPYRLQDGHFPAALRGGRDAGETADRAVCGHARQ